MIYPDENMLYAPAEWQDCSEGYTDIRYQKSADGIAKIDNVPEGSATVKVWQALQLVEKAPQTVVVSASPSKLTFQLDVLARRRRG